MQMNEFQHELFMLNFFEVVDKTFNKKIVLQYPKSCDTEQVPGSEA